MRSKKLMATLLAGTMALSLAACSSSSSEDKTSTSSKAAESKTEDAGKDDTTKAPDESKAPEETKAPDAETDAPAPSGETIKLTIWGAEEDQDLLKTLVDGFKSTYGSVANFDIQIGVESESTAKDTVLTDIEAAADVFAFASDQINDLYKAGALANIEQLAQAFEAYAGKALDAVKSANSAGSVEAASIDGQLYAFPMAGDNGYFLYYDTSVFGEDDVKTWDGLLAKAEEKGVKAGMTLSSGWYNASFFYGAGFKTGLEADGTTSIDFDGTSADGFTGVDVTKAMIKLASNPAFLAINDGDVSNQIASGAVKAVVSGTWDTTAVEEAFGKDSWAATKLPTYKIGDKDVQQGSVAGFKFVGVNAYSKNVGWAALLAEYITNEESQAKRFEMRQIGPTNTNVAASEAVQANKALAALSQQSAYGFVQVVSGRFWDPTKAFGQMIAAGELSADDDAAIQKALDTMCEGVRQPAE